MIEIYTDGSSAKIGSGYGTVVMLDSPYIISEYLIIPNSVKSIEYPSNFNAAGEYILTVAVKYPPLRYVVIPNSITQINDSMFNSCGTLLSIKIPNTVTSIGHDAFNYCRSLQDIKIPDAVTTIGQNAFANTGLKNVVFKNTTGWKVSASQDMSNPIVLNSADLEKPDTLMTYLTKTSSDGGYCDYYWKRS